jgi:uncharacterized protein (TIGR03067 family)
MLALSTVFSALCFLPIADTPEEKAELAKWQGTWEVELQLVEGKEKTAAERTVVKLVVKDDGWEMHLKDNPKPIKATIKIVLDGKVKGLDVTLGEAVYRAIYLMDGDRAILRVGGDKQDRPKDFSTSGGPESGGIVIYRRVKK